MPEDLGGGDPSGQPPEPGRTTMARMYKHIERFQEAVQDHTAGTAALTLVERGETMAACEEYGLDLSELWLEPLSESRRVDVFLSTLNDRLAACIEPSLETGRTWLALQTRWQELMVEQRAREHAHRQTYIYYRLLWTIDLQLPRTAAGMREHWVKWHAVYAAHGRLAGLDSADVDLFCRRLEEPLNGRLPRLERYGALPEDQRTWAGFERMYFEEIAQVEADEAAAALAASAQER